MHQQFPISIPRVLTGRMISMALLWLMISAPVTGVAQHTSGRWSATVRTGVNSFITDFNESKIGFGLEGRGMYGLSRNVSVGAIFGYEELKTHLDPNTLGLPYDYVKLHAFPLAAFGTYHALPGNKIAPYFSAGVGLLFYQRLDWQKNGLPDDGLNTSILVPISVGAEIYMNQNLSISAEIGYRVLDDKTETLEDGGFDSYATAKVGGTWYFGKSDEDDDDLDGLTIAQENEYGTDPTLIDTDTDGLKDGDEVRLYSTNPLSLDTDGDGLPDGQELFKWKTDPRRTDTDGDGLTDLEEAELGSNPINPDTDGDVLTDGEEKTAGSNPLAVDSDRDGLSDYQELRTHHTLVNESDTDSDSLSDGQEVSQTMTDPLKADTDGGGAIDGMEVAQQTDPLEPSDDLTVTPAAPDQTKPIYVYGVNFVPRTGSIGRGSETALENAFITLVLLGDVNVDVISHTDNTGSAEDNEKLSLAQARAVVAWLVSVGVDEKRLRPVGRGGSEPIATNDTEAGRALNRRIELRVRR